MIICSDFHQWFSFSIKLERMQTSVEGENYKTLWHRRCDWFRATLRSLNISILTNFFPLIEVYWTSWLFFFHISDLYDTTNYGIAFDIISLMFFLLHCCYWSFRRVFLSLAFLEGGKRASSPQRESGCWRRESLLKKRESLLKNQKVC